KSNQEILFICRERDGWLAGNSKKNRSEASIACETEGNIPLSFNVANKHRVHPLQGTIQRIMKRKFPYRYRLLIFLFFLILITYLDRICIALVGVRIKEEFKLSNEQFGWVLASFILAYALFEIPAGVQSDRF